MKKIIISSCIILTVSASADELEIFQQAQRSVEQERQTLIALKDENQKLLKTIETLKTAAQVTLDPSKAPKTKKAKKIEVLYKNPLDSLKGFKGIKGEPLLATQNGRKVFELKAPGAGCVRTVLNVPENSTLLFSCWIKGEQIKATRRNGGSRVGLFYKVDGKSYWPAAKSLTGDFDWLKASFKASIPLGCTKVTLLLGLAGAQGTIYMRDLSVEQIK